MAYGHVLENGNTQLDFTEVSGSLGRQLRKQSVGVEFPGSRIPPFYLRFSGTIPEACHKKPGCEQPEAETLPSNAQGYGFEAANAEREASSSICARRFLQRGRGSSWKLSKQQLEATMS